LLTICRFAITLIFFSWLNSSLANNDARLDVVYFSQDPPSIESLSPAFDPDSYAVISQIFDPLIMFDLDGDIKPALATQWEQIDDTHWRFWLRKGVTFHNGEQFDGHAVKFTFDYILNPKNNAGNAWLFSSLKKVAIDPQDPYQVIFETNFPDGMFLYRLNMFSAICPPKYIQKYGTTHFALHPIGTGPYKFEKWNKGQNILLSKNVRYWQKNIPDYQEVNFQILPQHQWVDALLEGSVDFIPNLQGKDTSNLLKKAQGKIKVIKRLVLSGYWVMIKNQGPLANIEVRKALNFAVNKHDLVRFADAGNAKPLASLGKQGEFGQKNGLTPYPYSPDKARQILRQQNAEGLHLKVLAADISQSVAKIIKRNLEDVGISIDLEVVSRSEWANRVVGYKIKNSRPAEYDMVINLVDNPIHNLAFHAGLFLHSQSPWALLQSEEFDQKFDYSLKIADAKQHEQRLQELDQYIHDNALMLFTTQRIITAAVSDQVSIDKFSLNGHLDYFILSHAKKITPAKRERNDNAQ